MDIQVAGIVMIVAFLVLVLIVAFITANEFQEVANEKGYNSSKYFWYVFLLGIVGCLLVIALPDRKHNCETKKRKNYVSEDYNDELPDL